jgi:hypothetical protein
MSTADFESGSTVGICPDFTASESESSGRSNNFSEKLGNAEFAADRADADSNRTSKVIFMAEHATCEWRLSLPNVKVEPRRELAPFWAAEPFTEKGYGWRSGRKFQSQNVNPSDRSG